MGSYSNALKYIKERKDEKYEIIYEWEISKEQWHHCMEPKVKEEISDIIIRLFVIFGILIVIFLLSFLFDSPYYARREIARLIPFTFFTTIILSFLPFLLQIKSLFYPEQYKFFIDNHDGIFNGLFYAQLKYFSEKPLSLPYILPDSSCEKYKLFENENKFEIWYSHYGACVINGGSRKKWHCFMFNNKDKRILYKIIKNWQEDGKIKPYRHSDRLILEKYFDKIK